MTSNRIKNHWTRRSQPALTAKPSHKTRGASLIVVMLILIIVSILGVSGIQIAMMGERGTRNDRDSQVAWQAAEAALVDAEFDIEGLPASSLTKRNTLFKSGATDIAQFVSDCGSTGDNKGLCTLVEGNSKPAWLTVNFENTANNARSVAFGTFTQRSFPSGTQGIQPEQAPRYVIEAIPDPQYSRTTPQTRYVYRITAMGFGPNAQTQSVVQTTYRN